MASGVYIFVSDLYTVYLHFQVAYYPKPTQSIPIDILLPRNRAVDLPRVFTFGVSVASNALDNLTDSATS